MGIMTASFGECHRSQSKAKHTQKHLLPSYIPTRVIATKGKDKTYLQWHHLRG